LAKQLEPTVSSTNHHRYAGHAYTTVEQHHQVHTRGQSGRIHGEALRGVHPLTNEQPTCRIQNVNLVHLQPSWQYVENMGVGII
jgi:hypothetical protein